MKNEADIIAKRLQVDVLKCWILKRMQKKAHGTLRATKKDKLSCQLEIERLALVDSSKGNLDFLNR